MWITAAVRLINRSEEKSPLIMISEQLRIRTESDVSPGVSSSRRSAGSTQHTPESVQLFTVSIDFLCHLRL